VRAATYTRISSELQADGHSLDAQAAACERLCSERGWQIVARYSDVQSGSTANRPQFRAMLAEAENRQFDVLVVHKIDRFSRSMVDIMLTFKRLYECGVLFVSVTEQFDFTTSTGKLMLAICSAFAQWYLDNLSDETKKGKRARAEKGMWNGMVPWGYSVAYIKNQGDGKPVVNPHAAAGVRLAFESYAQGQYSDLDIAGLLNDAGFRPQGRGKRALPLWSKDSVRWLLTNPFYTGQVHYLAAAIKGQHDQIISPELFGRCQDIRATRRHKYGCTARNGSHVYPLGGLARCARCGGHMRAASSKVGQHYRYYRDTAREHSADCSQLWVRAERAEDAVGTFLSDLALPDDWQAQIIRMVGESTGRVDYEGETRRLNQKLDRLRQLFLMGDIARPQYMSERDAIQSMLKQLAPPQLPDLEQAAVILKDFSCIWQNAMPMERKRILHELLDAVWLDYEKGPVVAITPKPQYQALFVHIRGRRARHTNVTEIRILEVGDTP